MQLLSAQPEKYLKVQSFDGYNIYIPVNTADGYHTSRYVEAINQNIYAESGANKEVLREIMEAILLRCNKSFDKDTFRTDISLLANNILYRLAHPVDQHCAIRLGAILTFCEYEYDGKMVTENPDKVESFWLQKKEQLAMNNPDAYAFFLQLGVSNSPIYSSQSDILTDLNYFSQREQMINSLMPQS